MERQSVACCFRLFWFRNEFTRNFNAAIPSWNTWRASWKTFYRWNCTTSCLSNSTTVSTVSLFPNFITLLVFIVTFLFNGKSPFDAKNPFLAQVTAWRELHRGGERSCMHIELDIANSKLRYDAGEFLLDFIVIQHMNEHVSNLEFPQ